MNLAHVYFFLESESTTSLMKATKEKPGKHLNTSEKYQHFVRLLCFWCFWKQRIRFSSIFRLCRWMQRLLCSSSFFPFGSRHRTCCESLEFSWRLEALYVEPSRTGKSVKKYCCGQSSVSNKKTKTPFPGNCSFGQRKTDTALFCCLFVHHVAKTLHFIMFFSRHVTHVSHHVRENPHVEM